MATELDTEMLAEVTETVTEIGRPVKYYFEQATRYNPATRENLTLGKKSLTLKVSPPYSFDIKDVDGDNIRQGDCKVILPAKPPTLQSDGASYVATTLPFTPEPNHRLELDGELWNVENVTPFSPGEIVIAYELHLRKQKR